MIEKLSKRIGHVIAIMAVITLLLISGMISLGLITMVGKGLWWIVQK